MAQLTLTTQGQEAIFKILSELSTRWLALGGGGYAIDVVSRAWTIAFGVMTDQTFSDELPTSFRKRYGGERLHDRDVPSIHIERDVRIRTFVEKTVSVVKRLHDIK